LEGEGVLTFNLLLNAAGISPATTRLLRHQDNRMKSGLTTYILWRRDPNEFHRYESTQTPEAFRDASHIASFVVDPEGDPVFVGLSRILSCAFNAEVETFEYIGVTHPPGAVYRYQLERDARFGELEGKVVIDWGPGARSWIQDLHARPLLCRRARAPGRIDLITSAPQNRKRRSDQPVAERRDPLPVVQENPERKTLSRRLA
jgi:hypothetical protein